MQINILNPKIKEFLKYLGWILFIILWVSDCSGGAKATQKIKVKSPKVTQTFNPVKPEHKPILIDEKPIREKDGVFIKNPIDAQLLIENQKLKDSFRLLSDSLKNYNYARAIELKKFDAKFEDDNIIINIDGIVQGEVKNVFPHYIWKEKTFDVEIKPKEPTRKVLAGLEVGNNVDLNNPIIKANLMFQNKKGNIFSGSIDSKKNYWLGYNVIIF